MDHPRDAVSAIFRTVLGGSLQMPEGFAPFLMLMLQILKIFMVNQLGNGVGMVDFLEFLLTCAYCFSPLKGSLHKAFCVMVILNCLNTQKFLFSLVFYCIFLLDNQDEPAASKEDFAWGKDALGMGQLTSGAHQPADSPHPRRPRTHSL